MKKIHYGILVLFAMLASSAAFAQTANVRGLLADEYGNPMNGVTVTLIGTSFTTVTEATGAFNFTGVPYGDYELVIKETDYTPISRKVTISQELFDVGKVTMTADAGKTPPEDQLPVVSLDDADEAASSQGVSSALGASRDAFASAATYTFSVARFDVRGYGDENFITLMDGAPMMTLTNGRTIYAWGGLNDVTRNSITEYGLKPSNYTFGGIGGSFNLDCRASRQRRQTQVTYSISNRAYENRLMATYGSGLMKGGWAVSASLSRRWAQEGYVPGTFYDGWSYYFGVEKIIGNHSISLTHFGVSTEYGRSASAVDEAFTLTDDHYYNPLWGYQDGEKRNSAVNKIYTPLTVLSHEWKINKTSSLQSAISYQFGKENRGGLNWFNASNPRGDYYRKLPSFIPFLIVDPASAAAAQADVQSSIINDPSLLQINWNALYETNTDSIETFKGTTGHRANYMVEDKIEDNHNFAFNTIYNTFLAADMPFSGGLTYQSQKTDYYKEITDLLGADYYVDLNQFAEQSPIPGVDAAQNDLNNPDRIIREGDQFGYNATSTVNQAQVWAQPQYKGKNVDAFIGIQISHTTFFREGHYKNGVFSENSYGKSEEFDYTNIIIKAGGTYKINGRNYLYGNFAWGDRAPYYDDIFVAPTVNNQTVEDPVDVGIASVEGGYVYKSPTLRAQAVFYSTQLKDMSHIYHYYNDDLSSFVNLAVSNIDERHAGMELAAEATVYKGLNVSAVASVGNYYYTSRQRGTTTSDNLSNIAIVDEKIYSENYKAGQGPQSAYTLGAFYRGKEFWTAGININYFDNMYVRFNPMRRTLNAVETLSDGEQRDAILGQEKLDGQLTVDLHASKSFKLKTKFTKPYRNTYFIVNAGVNNVLNNQDFKFSGGEQLRVDYQTKSVTKFNAKYNYAFGINYFISVILRMN